MDFLDCHCRCMMMTTWNLYWGKRGWIVSRGHHAPTPRGLTRDRPRFIRIPSSKVRDHRLSSSKARLGSVSTSFRLEGSNLGVQWKTFGSRVQHNTAFLSTNGGSMKMIYYRIMSKFVHFPKFWNSRKWNIYICLNKAMHIWIVFWLFYFLRKW